MKGILKAAAIITAAAAMLAGAYQTGHTAGVRHAIEDCQVWLPEGYTTTEIRAWPDIDDETLWYDAEDDSYCYEFPIEICLDEQCYIHGAYMN